MNQSRYTAEWVRLAVEQDMTRLMEPWMVGRSPNYTCDLATKHTIATGYLLERELVKLGVNDADRRTQCWKFNRLSRTYDIFETAAECLNDVLDGTVEQDRKPHRRWG